jgi:DNA-binding NtrC family response regulator
MRRAADIAEACSNGNNPCPSAGTTGTAATAARLLAMARILILEDNYMQAADAERILLDAGHDVVGLAPLTQIAMAIARIRPPELLICDLQLALNLDGARSAAELSKLYDCKVLIATGFPERVTGEIGVTPCAILTKPFSERMLLRAVEDCLNGGATAAGAP